MTILLTFLDMNCFTITGSISVCLLVFEGALTSFSLQYSGTGCTSG
jgi:hypothetical protein